MGSPTANRPRPELERLIGFFANTLVLRADLDGVPTLRELVRRVRESTLDAYAHQDVPFERLVEELQPERRLDHGPLVQVMFAVQNAPTGRAQWPDVRLSTLSDEALGDTARFDLTLSLSESRDGWHGHVEYNSDLFERDSVAALADRFQVLLDGALEAPERPLDGLPIVSAAERTALLTGPNRTAVPRDPEESLTDLVAAQVARTPDAVAVSFGDHQLTYSALWRRAGRIAAKLAARGVSTESRVAVCLHRETALVVTLLAVLRSGAAYVPLDPDYPADRLRLMLDDCSAALVVTRAAVAGRLPSGGAEPGSALLLLEELDGGPDAAPTPVPRTPADALAYVIHTSGSTGVPKGAMNAHRGIVNRLRWMQERYGLTDADRVLQKTPFSFDVSVWEFFWPLICGARVVVAGPGGHRDTAYLTGLVDEQAITTMHFVPSMLAAFLEEPDVSRCRGLRRVISSGEALGGALRDRFFAELGATELHNLYGPTEAAVDVTAWTCRPADTGATVPIGRPVANVQVYVLDPWLHPVPAGAAGELYLGGVQVGRGYLDRPALTAQRFVADPFGPAGGRLYRTGDQARWRRDGSLEFLGRLDDQVKIRGFRIEPGEIDAVVGAHPGVRSVATVVRTDSGDPRLVCYLVPAPGQRDGVVEAVRDRCTARLPGHLVPAVFVVLPELPVTPNGKLDRRALPAPGPDGTDGGTRYAPPVTPTQEKIVALWQELLGVDRVGIRDNFFRLGGHSLLATRMGARLRGALGVDVPLRRLFEAVTVEALAAEVDRLAPAGPSTTITRVDRSAYRRPRPGGR